MIYLTGYGRGVPTDLLPLADKHKAQWVCDIRYYRSGATRPEWSETNLKEVCGDRYFPLAQWGNKGKYQGEIEIADYEGGLEIVRKKPGNVLAFCACGKADTCHRSVIADNLKLELPNVDFKLVNWPIPENPIGTHWDRKLKRLVKDKLAEMEEYAAQNILTAEQQKKLDDTRFEYSNIERLLLIRLAQSELCEEELNGWADSHWLDQKTCLSVLNRLKQREMLDYDCVGPSLTGAWYHWYTLKEKKSAKESRRNGASNNARGKSKRTVQRDGRTGVGELADALLSVR